MIITLIELFLVVVLTSAGQLLIKMGATSLVVPDNILLLPLSVLRNPMFILSGLVYAVDFVLYVDVLSKVRLSIAYPFMGLTYAVVVFASVKLLGEDVATPAYAGIAFIVLGVGLVGLGLNGG